MRLLLAAALALASASALGQDAPAAEETDEQACYALQLIQVVAECALNGIGNYQE